MYFLSDLKYTIIEPLNAMSDLFTKTQLFLTSVTIARDRSVCRGMLELKKTKKDCKKFNGLINQNKNVLFMLCIRF